MNYFFEQKQRYSNFSIKSFFILIFFIIFYQNKSLFFDKILENFSGFFLENQFSESIIFFLKQFLIFGKKFLFFLYDGLYYEAFNIPIFFWLILFINIFLIFIFGFENFRSNIQDLKLTYIASQNETWQSKYKAFQGFIASSYGSLSIACISEIIILLSNYGTMGSIFWMVITVLLMGGVQMVEIIINCNYVKQSNEKTCYISAFQYMVNKYSTSFGGKNTGQYILKIAGIYAILAISISFFSAVLFQVEQFGNVFYRHFHSVNIDQFIVLAIFGPILLTVFLIATFSHFKHGLRFNSLILPPVLVFYLMVLIFFLLFNFDKFFIVSIQIIDDIFNPDCILAGIVSGAVISFARYIYKSRDYREDVWHIYEESDEKKSILMYGLESFFMIFLIILSGVSYIIVENFSDSLFLGINIKYFLIFSLLFFSLSLIINEAFYGRIVLSHIIRFGQKNLNIIIRLIMIFGVMLGLLKQADQLVDIADHLSIIFLVINLVSVFFIIKDLKFFINRLKNLE